MTAIGQELRESQRVLLPRSIERGDLGHRTADGGHLEEPIARREDDHILRIPGAAERDERSPAARLCTEPPATFVRFNVACAKNPSERLSGDQKG